MDQTGVVIVGSGQGGYQVAASLRDDGYQGAIVLVGEEPGLPYQRPPLSKGFLGGKTQEYELELRPESFYPGRGITLISAQRALRINRAERRVALADGRELSYRHLVLATGTRPRLLTVPGAELDNVLPLRSRADAQSIHAQLKTARRVVVVGAGFIGLEVAVIAQAMGCEVHVIEFADRALKRAVSKEVAEFLVKVQMQRGVTFSFSTGVASLAGDGTKVTAVVTDTGRTVPADLVVVGVGVEPNVELARDAGLAVNDGIVVNAELLTSDPAISAIGDCARFPADYCTAPVRLESVQNAVDQARCVAARLAGKAAPDARYNKLPWFWSDQGEYRLQIAGVSAAEDEAVVRGDIAQGRFSILRFRGERLTAVESINSAADHMAARKLLTEGASVSRSQATDISLKLASLARSS
ncbi:FAD-dependent oxidoreductase [Hydrogenophaga aromaticivorans]|jgi:3-phenylpropionate/trans-cinnamate dioxygenase ferredoxin reductase subunit|uniref:NAD(P)/FAD-dependent oxidoreductase n=1 Tax=Hydrogenophaga TaxID=47420 RepID=UPI001B3966E2|nr:MULTISPECIES: FAD-dependent oxidoreductase [Hydrogenophaga]MBQ0918832.1 FAD-dependent oxidoreductase [Hydrogenophaga aromaticivorans]MDO9481660.1 FAD-dependent oxidoreductase [Hydrogenophaga sp.]MDP3345551.1 FAD-dependent oxidoreductase [Hydrogenophaga sp.]MDP3926689.1 FAD-dependent oxidoreductase [Hydrogenophaga sp.]